MSFRMSARAKGMLSSVGDDDGGDNGRTYIAAANGEDTGPAVDEAEVNKTKEGAGGGAIEAIK